MLLIQHIPPTRVRLQSLATRVLSAAPPTIEPLGDAALEIPVPIERGRRRIPAAAFGAHIASFGATAFRPHALAGIVVRVEEVVSVWASCW